MSFNKENFALHTQRIGEKLMDWSTFQKQGVYKPEYARAHVRMVGGSITGKHDEPDVIPAQGFTLSLMMMPPGSVAPSHSHECEEVFFCLQGSLVAWWEDENGARLETLLQVNEMMHSPAGVLHGIRNETQGDALVQVIIGLGRPAKPIYADDNLSNLG